MTSNNLGIFLRLQGPTVCKRYAQSGRHILIVVSQMGNLLRAASALLSLPLLNNELNYFIKYSFFHLFLAVVLFIYISNVSMCM